MTQQRSRIRSIAPLGIGVWLVASLLATPATAFDFIGTDSHILPEDETHVGDLYAAAQTVTILGTMDGDLIAGGDTVDVFGTVTGDLIAGGNFVTVTGTVQDAARLAGQKLTVSGTIEGDLIMFGQIISLSHGARVTGDVLAFGNQLRIDGDVDGDVIANGALVWIGGSVAGDVTGTAGQITLSGNLAQNAKFKSDSLKVDESASIGGDLGYTAREQVENLEEMAVVAGTIDYQKTEKKTQTKKSKYTFGWFFRKLVAFLAALITGFVLIRLFPERANAIQAAVGRDPLPSFGVGFVIAIVLPIAALIVCIAIVTIPLSIITFLLYLIGLYLAKYPVALWLGRTLLGYAGMPSPSPYLALAVGLFPLVVLFQLPYLGWLMWFGTIFVGMGAIFLGLQSRSRSQSGPGEGATAPAVPPAPTTTPA